VTTIENNYSPPPSPIVEEEPIDTSMKAANRVGFLIFFLVFGVFGLWAGFAPLDGAAHAAGTVMVKSYRQVVQHLEGGIISEIKVQNGDSVRAGEALLVMDNTQSMAQLEIANAQFVALKAREARLIAERDGLDAVTFSEALSATASSVRQEIQAQNGIFLARHAANAGAVEVLQQRIGQLREKVAGLEALRASKLTLAASFAEELGDTEVLLSQGFSNKTRLREFERNHATFEGQAAEHASDIASTEVQIGETRLQILQLQREFQNEVAMQLGETQTNLNDINERLTALRDIVSRTVVKAPVAGVVNGMQFHTEGGVIAPGTQIADIVPQGSELIIDAQVSPMDIDRVAIGLDATIRFSAFGSSVPTIFGKVINLSADAFQNPQTGAPFYMAQVEVTPEGMADLGDFVLLPGMPAEIFINSGSRTFLQYVFKPFSNALARSFIED
jgi:epimerase transport system membrane fusion protein